MTWLSLWGNDIEDISLLAGLTALEDLWLTENRIRDLAPLAGLPALESLVLAVNQVTDISPLAKLPSLRRLELRHNEVKDLSPLTGLTGLTSLSLWGNDVEDISPLAGLIALERLWLNENRIRDLSPLAGLTRLQRLVLGYNKIADIAVLENLTHLRYLSLGRNVVSDLSALATLTRLEELGLAENTVADLSPLAAMTHLWWLDVTGNEVSDLSPLAGLTALTRLRLNRNRIGDISPLAGLTSLKWLWLSENDIEDISPLARLARLRTLSLDYNRVVDVAALEALTDLSSLRLAYNRITDLSPLANNTGLDDGDFIDVRGNPLSEESATTVVPALLARGTRVITNTPADLELLHDDNVMVLRVAENIRTKTLFNGLPLDEYAQVVYSHFEDVFDFVMFFSNLDDIDDHANPRYYGVYSAVRNDTVGTGLSTFYTRRYGSAETLKGVIHFPYNRALVSGPSLHELLHAWANYTIPTAVGAHWGFSSADGQLGGFDPGDLVELGNDRYAAARFGTFANGGNGPPYSPIELYFAGYIPPEEVPDLWVAADGEWVFEDGDHVTTENGQEVFSARDVKTYSIEDIVAENGARIPSMGDAQWHFRVAVVLLTDADHPATTEQLDLLSEHAASFSLKGSDGRDWLHNYYEATRGLGSVTMGGLSEFRKAEPAALAELPASFGVVPEPYLSMIDRRCLPMSAVSLTERSRRDDSLRREAETLGQAFFIGEK